MDSLVWLVHRTVLTRTLTGSEPFARFSPSPPSSLHLSCGRHGPAKQTAVHPATWLELHCPYEWQHQPYTPRSLGVICGLCMRASSESVCLSGFCFFYWVTSIFCCSFLIVDIPVDTQTAWVFAIHQLRMYSLGLYLLFSGRNLGLEL